MKNINKTESYAEKNNKEYEVVNLKNLLEINDKIEIVESVVKTLACGVTGNGALASIENICNKFNKN